MAKQIYTSETISLQDGRTVTLVPLPVGRLKKFMKVWDRFNDLKEEEEAIEIYVDVCGIALDKDYADDYEERVKEDLTLNAQYKEYLEDVLDLDTIFEIIKVCGGIDLNSPKLQEALEKAQAELGTTST